MVMCARLDISGDGSTRVVRADTYGAYLWESGQWKQLVTSTSMPAEDVGRSETRVSGRSGWPLLVQRGQSWTRIGDNPLGSLDEVKAIEGDKNTYGTVYVGFAGSGHAYGRVD